MRDCVVFIMTHGRADRVYTFDSLRKHGYTGPIYLVIDTDDEQGEEYIKRYGRDRVLIFDKKEEEALMDTGDIEGSMKCVVFARNVCFRFAKNLGTSISSRPMTITQVFPTASRRGTNCVVSRRTISTTFSRRCSSFSMIQMR